MSDRICPGCKEVAARVADEEASYYGDGTQPRLAAVMIANRIRALPETAPDSSGLRPEVRAFAALMERVLRENDHKGGWQNEHPLYLLERLMDETHELRSATSHGKSSEVAREAADVANFAMMIADVCGALPKPAPESAPDAGLVEALDDARIYPCVDCGLMRSKAEGGTTFTVCDTCWDKHFKPAAPSPPDASAEQAELDDMLSLDKTYQDAPSVPLLIGDEVSAEQATIAASPCPCGDADLHCEPGDSPECMCPGCAICARFVERHVAEQAVAEACAAVAHECMIECKAEGEVCHPSSREIVIAKYYEAQRVRDRISSGAWREFMPAKAPCVSGSGRTDGHMTYVTFSADGTLICGFCGRRDGPAKGKG